MPDRREALTKASSSLREIATALQTLTQPGDKDLTLGMRFLLDAIDRVDVTAHSVSQDRGGSSVGTEPLRVPAVTPGTYVRIRREALGMTRETVALKLKSDPPVSARLREQWLEALEDDAVEISDHTALVLHDILGIDLQMLAYWMAIAEGASPSFGDRLSAAAPETVVQ